MWSSEGVNHDGEGADGHDGADCVVPVGAVGCDGEVSLGANNSVDTECVVAHFDECIMGVAWERGSDEGPQEYVIGSSALRRTAILLGRRGAFFNKYSVG